MRRRRLASIFLALVMVVSVVSVAAHAAETRLPFTDVKTTDWFYDAVKYVYKEGMMTGTSETTFSPEGTSTRGMIVTILHRLEGKPTAAAASFADVEQTQYYADAVGWANANAIVTGYSSDKFGPNDAITREQMATILYRFAQFKGYDTSAAGDLDKFSDSGAISAYAKQAMAWANAQGLINGMGNDTLAPAGTATRAQVAAILMRFCQNVKPATDSKTHTVTFLYNYEDKGTYKAVQVADGAKVDTPAVPSRSGYSFQGWYTAASQGAKFDFTAGITADVTVYAQWQKASSGGGGSSSGGSPSGGGQAQEPATEADTYYADNSTVLAVKDAATSKDAMTEDEAKTVLEDRGFGDYPVTYMYDMGGEYMDENEAKDDSQEKHPMYQTYYLAETGDLWTIYIIDGAVFAYPASYVLESNPSVEVLFSETRTLTSYDDIGNKFYVTQPKESGAILKTVEKIDAATLDKLTREEIGK